MNELKWPAIGAGLALALAILALTRVAVGTQALAGGELGLQFVVLVVGGFAAARLAGRVGVAHGLAVAVGFILGATAVQSWAEMNLAGSLGPDAVAPIDLGNLVVADLVHLCAGLLGGWLARTGGMPARE